uniref:Uncharacterized protein n=1 Tax=Candidatus Methanophagaceae archaeon ANME-1 ERB6 TaxID=2759912 RepID=A0A7G9YYQ3_9EURY|nr:hypothetical protein GJIJNDME_00023 [Methanosarcinales archaeon ANME-1 ERB6]
MTHSTNTGRALRISMVMLAIAALLLCSTLVTGVGAGIAVAQEQESQQQPLAEYCEGERDAQGEAEAELAMDDDDVPVKVVYRGYGFALNADGTGTEFHALRVNIIRVRQLEPIRIRELMAQNKSIDEIRGEIMEKACAPTYQGYMQFAETHYKLVNINVNYTSHAKDSLAVNKLAIDADIIQVPVPTSIPMPMPTQDAAETELEPTGNGSEKGDGNASTENPYQSQGQDQNAGDISLNVLNLGHVNFITIGEGKLTIRECGEASQFQYHVLLRSER